MHRFLYLRWEENSGKMILHRVFEDVYLGTFAILQLEKTRFNYPFNHYFTDKGDHGRLLDMGELQRTLTALDNQRVNHLIIYGDLEKRSDLPKFLEEASRKFSLSVESPYMNEDTLNMAEKHVSHYSVELDDPPDLHEKVRGKGSYDDVLSFLEILKNSNKPFSILTLLNEESDIDQVCQIRKEFNATHIQPFFFFGRRGELKYYEITRDKINRLAEEYDREDYIRFGFLSKSKIRQFPSKRIYIHITKTGFVLPSSFCLLGDNIENIKRKSLKQMLGQQNKDLQRFLKRMESTHALCLESSDTFIYFDHFFREAIE